MIQVFLRLALTTETMRIWRPDSYRGCVSSTVLKRQSQCWSKTC